MSDSPYKSPATTGNLANPPKRKSQLKRVGFYLFAVLVIGIVILMLLPLSRVNREPARRTTCLNNQRQIMLALLNYESANGEFPPAFTIDADGNRLHSWRSLILPYIEHVELHKKIDFAKPWDDPANKEARETIVPTYGCPSTRYEGGLTTYLGVLGDRSFFTGSVPQKLNSFTDGTSATIAVCDVTSSDAVHWMSPEDASVELVLSYGPDSKMNHPGLLNVVFVDGHISSMSLEKNSDDLRELKEFLSTSGPEK